MSYHVELTSKARRQFDKLPRNDLPVVEACIDALSLEPRPPRCEKIAGRHGLYRVRVGDYRVIHEVHDERLIVLVVQLGNRRDIYRTI